MPTENEEETGSNSPKEKDNLNIERNLLMFHRIITGTTTEQDARLLVIILFIVFAVGAVAGALAVRF